MNVVRETNIAQPVDRVWSVLADFGKISRWADNVDHSSLATEQEDGIGAVRRVQVGRTALLETIVEWEPGSGLAYSIDGLPIVREVVNAWKLEDVGGTTRVSLASRIDSNPLVGWIISRVLARESRNLLAGLTAYVEGTE